METRNIFGLSDALNVLTDIVEANNIFDIYNIAGSGIAILYASPNIDGFFESCGTIDYELTMDSIRVCYLSTLPPWPTELMTEDEAKIEAIKIAKTYYKQILEYLSTGIDNSPYNRLT